jgi:signal transduction histidine kinase/sugar phosphate isomerase/epimerase
MKFAFETIIWGRHIEDFEEMLKTVHSFGYQGIELAQRLEHVKVRQADGSTKTLLELGPDELERQLAKYPLADGTGHMQVIGLAGGTLRGRLDFCMRSQTFRPFLYVEDLDFPDEDILDAITADNPFILALHPHWFKKIQRIDHASSEIEKKIGHLISIRDTRTEPLTDKDTQALKDVYIQQIKLLPDTAHLTIAGDAIPGEIPSNERLAAVHLKDWKSVYGRYSHRYSQGFVALGNGIVREKIFQVRDQLKLNGFSGWLVVEQDLPGQGVKESLLRSTEWLLQSWNEPTGLNIPETNIISRRQLPALNSKSRMEASDVKELEFLRLLLPAATLGPRQFYQRAADALFTLGGYFAVQIYGWQPGKEDAIQKDELFRLGESGLHGNCPILQTNNCLCGVTTKNPEVHFFDLRGKNRANFKDTEFLQNLEALYCTASADSKHTLRMISVPVFNVSKPGHLRFVINLYPEPAFRFIQSEIEMLGCHLSRLADHVSSEICSAAFLKTSYLSQNTKDRMSYLDLLRDLIKDELACRGVTILLEDESRQRLKIISTTGVEWHPNIPEHKRYYERWEGQTGKVWADGVAALISNNNIHNINQPQSALSWEVGANVRCKECLYVPVGRPWDKPIGVVRVVDKIDPDDGCRATTMFTDDDAAVLDSIIQAALPQIELWALQERQLKALSRMTHEFKYPLLAIQGAVDQIRSEWRTRNIITEEILHQDYLEDILDWCQIMGNQAQNARIFSASPYGGLALDIGRVMLKADVIIPAMKHLRRFFKDQGIHEKEVEIGTFESVPALFVDKGQMLQVALNLISNAIKYRDPQRGFRMYINGYKHGSVYVIEFNDWGMGVPIGLEDLIFEPGYRSKAATLRDVTGQGIGLSVVRSVLASHGGQIKLSRHNGPTIFEVVLPEKLKSFDWPKKK